MNGRLTDFIDGLISYDYILFGGSFLVFILLIVLAMLLRRKAVLSILIITLSFSILILAPTLGYVKMHEYLFKNSTKLISEKKLHFTKAVVVIGSVTNESKVDFGSCKITASALKVSTNAFKDYIFSFKPIVKSSVIEYDIKKGDTREFKIIVEPFTYSKEYNISLGADCK